MQVRRLRLLIMMAGMVLVLLLTGCGASIKGSININSDGSGSRTMVGFIKNEDMAKLRGGEAALDEVLNRSKPEVLDIKKVNSGDGIQYVFSYDFKNFDEYLSKTEKIINRKPDSKFTVSGGIFNRTYKFTESNISHDLVKWAAEAVAKSWVEIINPRDIYKIEGNEVKLIENKVNFDSNIDISTNKLYEVDRIEVATIINKLSGYERDILYTFAKSTNDALNKQDNELYNYMIKLIPKGGKLKKIESDDYITYKISFSSNDLKNLNQKTRGASLDERASISMNKIGGNGISENLQEYSDTIDFIKFLEGTNIKNGISYRLTVPAENTFRKLGDMDIADKGSNIKLDETSELTVNKGQKTLIQNFEGNQINFNTQIKTKGQASLFVAGILLIIILLISGIFITKYIMNRHETKLKKSRENRSIDKTWTFETDWTAHINKEQSDDSEPPSL